MGTCTCTLENQTHMIFFPLKFYPGKRHSDASRQLCWTQGDAVCLRIPHLQTHVYIESLTLFAAFDTTLQLLMLLHASRDTWLSPVEPQRNSFVPVTLNWFLGRGYSLLHLLLMGCDKSGSVGLSNLSIGQKYFSKAILMGTLRAHGYHTVHMSSKIAQGFNIRGVSFCGLNVRAWV